MQTRPAAVSATTVPPRSRRRARAVDDARRHVEQLLRRLGQFLPRQAALPLVDRLHERVGDAGAGADGGGLLDAELAREGIGGDEADPADVARQAVGVLLDERDGVRTVGLVDPHGARCADAMAVEEHHDVADHLLTRPRLDDLRGAAGADAVDVAQPGRLGIDHLEYAIAECADELAREHGPMPRMRPDPR
jgi:hypothetical protein